jgi:hypothetical protein
MRGGGFRARACFSNQRETGVRILKNSWGKGWGEQGFIRMSMGMDVCGVADVVTRPLV